MTFQVNKGRDCRCSWLKRSTSEVTPCRCNTNIVTFGSCSDLGKECRSTVASPQRRSQQRVKTRWGSVGTLNAGKWNTCCCWMTPSVCAALQYYKQIWPGDSASSCSPDEVTAQNKQERFVKERDGKESVYDPNYHLCPSARFNHSHILSSRCTLQSLSLQPTHASAFAHK